MASVAEPSAERSISKNPSTLDSDAFQQAGPVTIIERQSGWRIVNLAELWRYRELLQFLAWRDIKVRYKQTVLGAAWAVLQPLATMVVFSLFLGRMAGIADKIEHYSLFVFSALLPWTFLATAITAASQSIVGSQNLVTKVFFPRLIIPVAALGAGFVDFLIGFGLLCAMMIYFGIVPRATVVLAALSTLLLVLAAVGVGSLLSALTVAYRDFRYVVPVAVQLWMFATPCIYLDATTVVGPRGLLLLPLNPAYGLILTFRQAVLGDPLDWYAFAVSAVVSVALLFIGCTYFRRVERNFADII
jgi:lipopolysaccharide transport system permease protein